MKTCAEFKVQPPWVCNVSMLSDPTIQAGSMMVSIIKEQRARPLAYSVFSALYCFVAYAGQTFSASFIKV